MLRVFRDQDGQPGAGRGAAAVRPALAEKLTACELKVLALLAAGMPSPRIAGQLVVTWTR